MAKFIFDFPKRVVFGPNTVSEVANEADRVFGRKSRILLVTDKTLTKIGLSDRVRKPLEEGGHQVDVFDSIEGEPTVPVAEAVSVVARKEKYNGVVGVGGGSSMDMAKMAAVASSNPRPIKDYIAYMVDKVEAAPLPKILVPTTSGTGSEATSYAVVVEGNFKSFLMSPKVVAETAILDPTMTATCPPKQTAGSGLDALSHAVEAVLSWKADLFSDTFAFRAIELIADNLRRAYHHGSDLEARGAMALASFYGGIAITTPAAVDLGHCISETIGPRYHIPHGLACGITLPYVMKFNIAAWPERVADLARYFTEEPHGDVFGRAQQAVDGVKQLLVDMDVTYALREYGVSRDEIKEMATFIAKEQQFNYELPGLNPRVITTENLLELFEHMYEGEL